MKPLTVVIAVCAMYVLPSAGCGNVIPLDLGWEFKWGKDRSKGEWKPVD